MPLHLLYHQHRLEHSLKTLGCDHTGYSLRDLIMPPDDGLYRCRFLYDAEGYTAQFHPYTPQTITSLKLVHADHLEYSHKYADREALNTLFQQRSGCDDILIVQNGTITDTTIANIAFYINHEWLTPDTPLLKGTTRARLLEKSDIKTASISISDALHAPKIALMNAMIGFYEMENGIIL